MSACDLMQNRNFRAKAIVDLAMSIECSLKSLIISLSKNIETPAKAYKIAKNLSHNLDNLHQEVKKRAKHRFKLKQRDDIVFENLKNLGIKSRYSQDLWSLRLQSKSGLFFLGDSLVSSTVDDSDWCDRVRKEALIWNTMAHRCNSKYMIKHSVLSGKKFDTYERELASFLHDVSKNKAK